MHITMLVEVKVLFLPFQFISKHMCTYICNYYTYVYTMCVCVLPLVLARTFSTILNRNSWRGHFCFILDQKEISRYFTIKHVCYMCGLFVVVFLVYNFYHVNEVPSLALIVC